MSDKQTEEKIEIMGDRPYKQDELPQEKDARIRQLLQARAMRPLDRIIQDGLILRVQELERRRHKEFVFGFMAGFGVAYALVEGLRWLLS